jgi:hypothetical protein
VGAKEIQAARCRLVATIANEIRANGSKPIGEDNAAYQAAKKAVDDLEKEADEASRLWD